MSATKATLRAVADIVNQIPRRLTWAVCWPALRLVGAAGSSSEYIGNGRYVNDGSLSERDRGALEMLASLFPAISYIILLVFAHHEWIRSVPLVEDVGGGLLAILLLLSLPAIDEVRVVSPEDADSDWRFSP